MKSRIDLFRWIFLAVFILATLVVFEPILRALMDYWFPTYYPGNIPPVIGDQDSLAVNLTISIISSIVALLGFLVTTVLSLRREKRDVRESQLSIKQKEIELEKMRIELEQLKQKLTMKSRKKTNSRTRK